MYSTWKYHHSTILWTYFILSAMLGGLSIKNNFFLIGYGQPLLREKLWRKDFLNLFNFEYYILGLMADYYLFTYFLKLFFDDSFPSRYFYENQKRKLAKFLCDDKYGPMIYIRHIYFMDLAMYGCKIRYINMVRIEFFHQCRGLN